LLRRVVTKRASDEFHARRTSELARHDSIEEDTEMLEQLSPFVGAWDLDVSLPSPHGVTARATFEWTLDGRFLLQRTEVSLPEAPNTLSVIGPDPRTGAYAQHYFDSRGVVRVYAMTFEDGVWSLVRASPDFSDLSFHQRYEGRFSGDGDAIAGHWDISHDEGATWERDFDVVYRRVG
jgi:hypothetical protein